VSYEYRVFMVHQAEESTFLDLSGERRVCHRSPEAGQRTRSPLRDHLLRAHAPARGKAWDRLRPRIASAGSGAGIGWRASG
jgi:hypothetical protein